MPIDERATVRGNWRLLHRMGEWSGGAVYLAKHKCDDRKALVKFERRHHSPSSLCHEYNTYHALGAVGHRVTGLPKVFAYGRHGDYNALVAVSMKWTLNCLVRQHCGLSIQCVMKVGRQVLEGLERMHSKGYIHGNVSPGNMMVNSETIYLVNLEQAKKYRSVGRHLGRTDGHRVKGEVNFASRNAHRGNSLSRRDDLESLGYSLVYMAYGRLPWSSSRLDEDKVRRKKRETSLRSLCGRMDRNMKYYMEHVTGLGFEEKPDYRMLKGYLDKVSREAGPVGGQVLDWI